MPYVITTRAPYYVDDWKQTRGGKESRHAVATLEEAVKRGLLPAPHNDGCRRDFLSRMPESGGTIGPLPDGTVIEVERVTWDYIREHRAPGVVERYPGDNGQPLIDSFNAPR